MSRRHRHHLQRPAGSSRRTTIFALVGAVAAVVVCAVVIVALRGTTDRRPGAAPASVSHSSGSPSAPSAPTASSASSESSGSASLAVVPPTYSPPTGAATSGAAMAPLTYTVQPGDNLASIAAWFHLHGYGALYDANKAVIGADPRLIHPGQIITISSAGVTVG